MKTSVARSKCALKFSNPNCPQQSDEQMVGKDKPVIDTEKIKSLIDQLGLSKQGLADLMGVERGTVFNLLKTGKASQDTVDRLFDALKIAEEDRRSRSILRESEEKVHTLTGPADWTVYSVESPILVAANGVSYQVAKLQSDLNPSRFVRGKFYDLRHLTAATLPARMEQLLRHSKVCAILHGEPRLPMHVDIRRLGKDSAWWVLDEWIDGKPLSHMIDESTLVDQSTVKTIGSEILLALATLHSHRIVVRELAPERVIVSDDMQHCVVTDFEMAKLLDSEISVRGKWKVQTPYRAPEVSRNSPAPQSDLFSWGVIMSELLTGRFDADEKAMKAVVKDKSIVNMVLRCRKVVSDERPSTSGEVLEIWNDWKT